MKHLLFYDGQCPLCNRAVRFVLATDQKKQFYFAPLNGKTAQRELADLHLKNPKLDTLVLLQNYGSNREKMWIEGKGVLCILWILGGKYAWLGWLCFLPSFLFDAIYRLIARYRYRIFKKKTPITDKERFLP